MTSQKTIIRYLFNACVEVDGAIASISTGRDMQVLYHTKRARHMIGIAGRYIMHKHIRECIGSMMTTASGDRVIDEVVKSYKIATR